MASIKDIVENPHWIYRRYNAYWDFLLQSYEGGLEYTNSQISGTRNPSGILEGLFNIFVNGKKQETPTLSGNLFQHTKERSDDYNRRVNMSYYYNFCDPIIDIYNDHLFKKGITKDYGIIDSTIQQIDNDIDRVGSSIDEFRKSLAQKGQIYGHSYVVVDSPNLSKTEIITRQDQINNRAFPYLSIYSPQNVLNWALDEFGFPYWVLLRETKDANSDIETFDKNRTQEVYYRVWTRNDWKLYDSKYQIIQEGINPIGRVPIVCVFNKKSDKARNFLGISAIGDISFVARDIYNSCSELRQILRDQTFAFLALQGHADEYSELELGTGKGIVYPPERNKPEYVSPPSSNAEVYFNHIDRQIAKIYQLAKLEGGSVKFSEESVTDGQSGISKAWDFNQTNSSLATKASNLEDGETRIWELVALWEGKEFDGSISYPDEFSISSLMADLTELEKETRLQFGKTFNVEVRKAILQKKFPRKEESEIDAMVEEIKTEFSAANNQANDLASRVTSYFNNNRSTNTATGGQNKQGA